MRLIKYIVLHCTATPQNTKVESIQRYWRDTMKWRDPGYHYLIEANGKVHNLQPIEKTTNGVRGHNVNSIHISYIGGIDKDNKPIDNRTPEQICEQINLLLTLQQEFPDAIILGHRDFSGVTKACPSFDVRSWLKSVGI